MPQTGQTIHAELIAVLVAVTQGVPRVLTLADGSTLPEGPLEPTHRSLQAGLRAWVEQQTHHPLGYVEQLYTFADQARRFEARGAERSISISYLGLTREAAPDQRISWQDWYRYFPWEDQRGEDRRGEPALEGRITDGLERWQARDATRRLRVAHAFGLDGIAWNEEVVLARYQLLYEAGLVPEAVRDGRSAHGELVAGSAMVADHRRILATAISRLRAKIKYRPVVFELLAESFSLLDLQRCVEALAGQHVHKSNFRRVMEGQNLLEETGKLTAGPGRPAKLFRFRAAVRAERDISDTRVPTMRT